MKVYLVILKRFEIWLLLAVVAGLVAFALKPLPEPAVAEGAGTEARARPPVAVAGFPERELPEKAEEEVAPPFSVTSVRVLPGEGGRIVELALLARAPGEDPVPLDETRLVATTAEGAPVPRFFEPFAPEPLALPGEGGEAVVRLWLESHAEALRLDFLGETAVAELPR